MKRHEFYIKHKTSYPPIVNPLFSKGNWWKITLIGLVAVLGGPLIVFKRQRSIPFSFDNYLKLIEYCSFIIIPLIAFLLLINWRESDKRNRGYCWLGKFDVINKQSSFLFCYLFLSPGNSKIKVNRELFEKIRVGDRVVVRKDALGKIEAVTKVKSFSNRFAKRGKKQISEQFKHV